MINSPDWSDPIRASIKRRPPADGRTGRSAAAALVTARPPRSSITLPARASLVAAARRFVARFVADQALADDAVSCLSEVVTNAVLHSNSRRVGGRFTISAERYGDGHLRIEVEDQGGRWLERAKAEGQQHLGLKIVSRLASAWGIESEDSHRRMVWFELPPVTSPPSAA